MLSYKKRGDLLLCFAAHVLRFTTPIYYTVDAARRTVVSKDNLRFKVKACKDAHVILFESVGDVIAYEIVLGGSGNTVSGIRSGRQQVSN